MSITDFADRRGRIARREAALLGLALAFLSLTALALVVAPAARAGTWQALGARGQALLVPPLWACVAWLLHRALGRARPARDPYLLPVALLLSGWGLLVVWRLSPAFGARQTSWFILAALALLELLRAPQDLRWLRRYRTVWLTAGIALAALTLFFGTNPGGGEPRLWLGCCGVYLQPSEPLRLLLIVYFASYLGERLALGRPAAGRALFLSLAPLFVAWGLSTALLVVQRDLGTGTLFLVLFAALLYLASGRRSVLLIAGALAVGGGGLGFALFGVVQRRLEAWLNPWADPIGGSYQIVQALIALGSGGVFGRGPGIGAPGFVPVAHTDFVFAAVVEEWGLLGGLAMVALLAILVARGLRAALHQREAFGVMLAAGLSLALGLQALWILGGVLRLLPLTGVTLPFVSYGGSSLVTTYLGLGLLLLLSGGRTVAVAYERELRHAHAGMLAAWCVVAAAVGWWSVVQGPTLTARTDNPRRALAERFSLRGEILDRHGEALALSTGARGAYQRSYPAAAAAAVVGYDSVLYAQSGVEATLDPVLRGEAGGDAVARWRHHLLTGTPPPGLDVRLTIDLRAQRAAAFALEGARGAVALLDARTGEILALATSPSFDPNRLDAEWSDLVARSDGPLVQRATQGRYPPGAALGPLLLAGALREGLADPLATAEGASEPVPADGFRVGCALALGADPPALAEALAAGCPTAAAELGAGLGQQALADLLSAFALDRPPLIPLAVAPASAPALDGTSAALLRESIGQGGLSVSPLQLARAFAALVEGGTLPPLQLIGAVGSDETGWQEQPASDRSSAVLPVAAARAALEALLGAGGGIPGVSAAAWTGTPPRPIAWYVGGRSDSERPLAVAVVLEGGDAARARSIGLYLLRSGAW